MEPMKMKTTSKVAKLLKYMRDTRRTEVCVGEAAEVMGCAISQVASLLALMVRGQMLRMTWHPDGQHYTWVDGLDIALTGRTQLTVTLRSADELEPELDQDDFLRIKRSWVKADGLPPPKTTAARSVFDLGVCHG